MESLTDDKRQELENEKLKVTRIWVTLMLLMGIVSGAVNYKRGFVTLPIYIGFWIFQSIIIVLMLASFYKPNLIIAALFLLVLRFNFSYMTNPSFEYATTVLEIDPIDILTRDLISILAVLVNAQIFTTLYQKF